MDPKIGIKSVILITVNDPKIENILANFKTLLADVGLVRQDDEKLLLGLGDNNGNRHFVDCSPEC